MRAGGNTRVAFTPLTHFARAMAQFSKDPSSGSAGTIPPPLVSSHLFPKWVASLGVPPIVGTAPENLNCMLDFEDFVVNGMCKSPVAQRPGEDKYHLLGSLEAAEDHLKKYIMPYVSATIHFV